MTIDTNDIIGKKFGRLTVIELDHVVERARSNGRKQNLYYYRCKCECGNETVVNRFELMRTNNPTKSCGCLVSELGKRNVKHGDSGTRFYHIWQNMLQRCYNLNHEAYKYYGAIGISVCDDWRQSPGGYLNFKRDMHDSYLKYVDEHGEENTTLDRISPFSNYSPENCRWATSSVQNSNKRATKYFIYEGQEYTKKQLYDNFTVNLSWNGFCKRLDKLETNEITDPEIFYHYESPIIDLHRYFNDEYLKLYIKKLNKEKEEAGIALRKRFGLDNN